MVELEPTESEAKVLEGGIVEVTEGDVEGVEVEDSDVLAIDCKDSDPEAEASKEEEIRDDPELEMALTELEGVVVGAAPEALGVVLVKIRSTAKVLPVESTSICWTYDTVTIAVVTAVACSKAVVPSAVPS